jgi:thiopurine S-methyltransferase
VTPLLQKYWPTLELPPGSTVLVLLCGKSRDMVWLAEQDFRVVGVELSQLAVEQFFAENELHPTVHQIAHARYYVTKRIEIICGDIFKVDAAVLAAARVCTIAAHWLRFRPPCARIMCAMCMGSYRGTIREY